MRSAGTAVARLIDVITKEENERAELHVALTREEASARRAVLECHLSDLRMEIADTDTPAFRDRLKEQEALLRGLLARLRV
jgi:hypothetical protein